MQSLTISSRDRKYKVYFNKEVPKTKCAIVDAHLLDKKIAYQDLLGLMPNENFKTLTAVQDVIDFMLDVGVQKKDTILVRGGGFIQDIGSFSAHIYKRGIEWIFEPTTLLAMADSCIGGKSGLNVGKYKNQVGVFHPPFEIYINTKWLLTLKAQDLRNGIAEMKKHFIIDGSLRSIKNIDADLIRESLLVKKNIIEQDEFDAGLRKVLNFGHTYGHALEAYTDGSVPHGEAVLWGMKCALIFAKLKNLISDVDYVSLYDYLRDAPKFKLNKRKYMTFLKQDKKAVGNEIDLILPYGVGDVRVRRTKLWDIYTAL